jgi:hypothetical protein
MNAKKFELKTRKPTCAVPWPQILIEGMEKSGKTWLCAEFSGSERIGRTFWLEIGPAAGTADQYGAVPGARYEIVEHDGSWKEIYGAVLKIHQEAGEALARGEKPTVLIVDVAGALWDLLKDWVSARAAVSKTNRSRLADDPAAELVIPRNLWNDATKRHAQIVTLFLTFPGIVLLTANGKEISATGPDGQPLANKKDWRVDTQKELPAYITCWVRMFREERARVIGARSVHAGVRPGHDEPRLLGKTWNLEWLIFDMLALDPATAYVREFTELQTGVMSPQQIRDEACNPLTGFERIRELYAVAKDAGFDDVTLQNETGDDENLLAMLFRIGNERKPKPHLAAAPAPADVTDEPAQPAASSGNWYDDAIVRAAGFKTDAAAGELFREAAAKARAGECTPGQATHVQNLINARIDDRHKDAARRILEPLAEADPWRDKILDGLASDEEARAALEGLEELSGTGQMDVDRAHLLGRAVVARRPKAGVKELKAPAREVAA